MALGEDIRKTKIKKECYCQKKKKRYSKNKFSHVVVMRIYSINFSDPIKGQRKKKEEREKFEVTLLMREREGGRKNVWLVMCKRFSSI